MTHYSNTPNPVDFPKQSTIDRLWGEALDKAVPDTYSTLTWTQIERIKAVFAELIVRECAKVVFEKTGPKSALNVLEHFGVEE